MTRYVKKRIPVDAEQFRLQEGEEFLIDAFARLAKFTEGNVAWEDLLVTDSGLDEYFVYDYLHKSYIQFKEGDWIVKGVRGEFYPCEESVFAETYEVWTDDAEAS